MIVELPLWGVRKAKIEGSCARFEKGELIKCRPKGSDRPKVLPEKLKSGREEADLRFCFRSSSIRVASRVSSQCVMLRGCCRWMS